MSNNTHPGSSRYSRGPGRRDGGRDRKRGALRNPLVWIAPFVLLVLLAWALLSSASGYRSIDTSDGIDLLKNQAKTIESVTVIDGNQRVELDLSSSYEQQPKKKGESAQNLGKKVQFTYTQAQADQVNELVQAANPSQGYDSVVPTTSWWSSMLQLFLPMLLFIAFFWWMMGRVSGGRGGAMGFGKSKAKLLTEHKGRKTFEDVAGVDEAGRGPLAGPVTAAAVILPARGIPRGLNDSKKLNAAERERIGRDLHDLAIQQLFATGMQITAAKQRLRDRAPDEPLDVDAVCAALDSSLAAVDDSVSQIRSIVRSLRDRDEDVSVVERLRREASLARTSLGYAPSLMLSVDGRDVSAAAERDAEDELIDAVDAAVDPDVADDMVAVVREGLSNIARHAHASSATVDILLTGVLPGGSVLADVDAGEAAAATDVEGSLGPAAHPVVEVVCRDDGVGVDPRVTRRSGTANMAERARRHGGTFVIGPRAHSDGERRGTCFTWRVPLDTAGRRG